ncbi:MAG: hypothetical protein MUD01_01760 [Chloroflexaceae bacterium]|jgi:hypothetical protein|nr:hypothetical protein [Chloroflexaceae bacterium]
MNAQTARIATQARDAGFQVAEIEQLRYNRWLLLLHTTAGERILALVQQRPLLTSNDVHDLAELMALRRPTAGLLVALDGHFSPTAQRSARELGLSNLTLSVGFPSAPASTAAAPAAAPALETL